MPKLPGHAIWITVAILWEELIVELNVHGNIWKNYTQTN